MVSFYQGRVERAPLSHFCVPLSSNGGDSVWGSPTPQLIIKLTLEPLEEKEPRLAGKKKTFRDVHIKSLFCFSPQKEKRSTRVHNKIKSLVSISKRVYALVTFTCQKVKAVYAKPLIYSICDMVLMKSQCESKVKYFSKIGFVHRWFSWIFRQVVFFFLTASSLSTSPANCRTF